MQKKKTKSSKAGAKMNKPLLKKKTASWAGDPEHFLPKSEAMKIIQANTDLANRCNELDVLHERAKERALKAEAELAEWKKKVTDREELEKKVAEAEKRREDDKERIMDLEHFVWVMTGQLNHFMLRGMVE